MLKEARRNGNSQHVNQQQGEGSFSIRALLHAIGKGSERSPLMKAIAAYGEYNVGREREGGGGVGGVDEIGKEKKKLC